MNRSSLLLCLLGISTSFFTGIVVAREAITEGKEVTFGDRIRYQVAILINDQPPECGGGIIAKAFVLTAAHCLIRPNGYLRGRQMSVLARTINLNVTGLVIAIDRFYVPQDYRPEDENRNSDIAVLKLRDEFNFENHLSFSKLNMAKNPQVTYEDKLVRIAGFGWNKMFDDTGEIGYHTDNSLRIAEATVLSHEQCLRNHQHRVEITEKHLCARVKQYNHDNLPRGVCIGDGGGPLVFNGQIIVGVLSLVTPNCSEKHSSGIYTSTKHYWKFINNAMGHVLKNMSVHYM